MSVLVSVRHFSWACVVALTSANGQISTGGLAGILATNTAIGALLGRIFAPTGWTPIPLPNR